MLLYPCRDTSAKLEIGTFLGYHLYVKTIVGQSHVFVTRKGAGVELM